MKNDNPRADREQCTCAVFIPSQCVAGFLRGTFFGDIGTPYSLPLALPRLWVPFRYRPFQWAGDVTAIAANFRDANGSSTEVLHELLVRHAPPLFLEAIVNGNKDPVVDENGWQTVRCLVGSAKQISSRQQVHDGCAGLKKR